jgi:hypothetical protein
LSVSGLDNGKWQQWTGAHAGIQHGSINRGWASLAHCRRDELTTSVSPRPSPHAAGLCSDRSSKSNINILPTMGMPLFATCRCGCWRPYNIDLGPREEFRTFGAAANVGYLTRTWNERVKAVNINHALQTRRSPYAATFDCDHVPKQTFLQLTVRWFLRDHKLRMQQTPHHFDSPDPGERNLSQIRIMSNQGEPFYGSGQDGNDSWDAALFCGSCAAQRRTALAEIGGIATATVTEETHTSLTIQKNGRNTVHINLRQSAGLATKSLSGHVSQLVQRPADTGQILRPGNFLFASGLTLPKGLFYLDAMMHFMCALRRLVFLAAPLLRLVVSCSNVPGYWAAILALTLPHQVLSTSANSRTQRRHRHSCWNEIYETLLTPYVLIPTILAMIARFCSCHLQPNGYLVGRFSWRLQINRWLTQTPWSLSGGVVVARCLPLALSATGARLVRGTAARRVLA